jgi:hypothetical protein
VEPHGLAQTPPASTPTQQQMQAQQQENTHKRAKADPDHTRWIAARIGFFLPVRVLSLVFRGKFVAGLRELHVAGKLGFHGTSH